MKRLVLLSLLLLPVCCFAQPGAIGFGVLRINVTRLDSLPVLLGAKLYVVGDVGYKADQRLKEMDSNWYAGLGRADTLRKKRFVKGYKIIQLADCTANGLELRKIELIFYKGILIQITAGVNNKIPDWFKSKYGAPEDHSKYDTVSCVNYYDGKPERNVNTEENYTWRRGGELAHYYFKYTYNSDCRMVFDGSFEMKDEEAAKLYWRLVDAR